MAKPRVLVTRPRAQQAELCALLQAAGYEPVSLPLLEISAIDLDAAEQALLRSRLLNLDLYQHVIFISRNAAQIGAELIDQFWPQLPVGIDWIAIGQSTADELEQFNIAARVNSGLDSEALLRDPGLQQLADQRILIVKGVGGRELLAQTLQQRGAKVELAEVYTRRLPVYSTAELEALLNPPPDAILISSGQAVKNLHELAVEQRKLQNCTMIVPSERVENDARALGYGDTLVAQGADNHAMLMALQQRLV